MLAALAPERVLPFASGGSRKRWLTPSRGSSLGNRGGAPKGERAPLPTLPRKRERAENKGARHTERCGTVVRLSAPRLPSFKGGFANDVVHKTRMRTHRENDFAHPSRANGEGGKGDR